MLLKVPSEIINPPGVVHITKLATPVNANNKMKILVAPPPPSLGDDKHQQVVDMDIDDQSEEAVIEVPDKSKDKAATSQPAYTVPSAITSRPPPQFTRPPPAQYMTSAPPQFLSNAPPPTYPPTTMGKFNKLFLFPNLKF